MDTNKIAYWTALAVLALGLNSEYRQGNFVALHRVAERADSALCAISARAERTLAVAMGATSRSEFAAAARSASVGRFANVRLQSDLLRERARDQAENVRDEILAKTEVIRAQAEVRRAVIEQVRSRTRSQFQLIDAGDRAAMTVFCPKTGARVVITQTISREGLSNDSPPVEVNDSF